MTTEISQSNSTNEHTPVPFGMRLQSAREALGLECKDTAAQLRLSENVILMMETDCYSSDLPMTFVRGYLRSYGKLLHIPDLEIKQAIEGIKLQLPPQGTNPSLTPKQAPQLTSSHYFMQLFTYLIIFTLIGLVSTWWYTHTTTPTLIESQLTPPDAPTGLPAPLNINPNSPTPPSNLGSKLAATNIPTTPPTPPTATKSAPTTANPPATPQNNTAVDEDEDEIDTNNTGRNSDNDD